MTAIKIIEITPAHALGYLPGIMLYVWRGPTSVSAATMLGEGCRRARDVAGDVPVVLFGAVEAGTPPPESDARKLLADSMKSCGDFIRASALAFEGEGFQSSIVRAVASGLGLLARVPYPHQVFSTVPLAGRVGRQKTVPQHSNAHLVQALTDLRQTK